MIDEAVLEDLLARLAEEIPIPPDGADHVVDNLVNMSKPEGGNRSRFTKPLLAVAAVVALIALAVPALRTSGNTSSKSTADSRVLTPSVAAPPTVQHSADLRGRPGSGSAGGGTANGVNEPPGAGAPRGASAPPPSGPVDSAKIVKTGTLDLQVPHTTLRTAVNRVTGAAVGFGGYVADSRTTYGGTNPTAEITIRVPVANFGTAVTHLDGLPGVKVLSDSENGADVTGQYTDLQAQLAAATAERDALLTILARAQSIGDILAVRDRETAAQTEVNQLQGQINVLADQAAFSSIAVTLSEKPVSVAPTTVHHSKPTTGLAKSWSDARKGFTNGVEWLIARSGGALIVLLAALALLFGIRYLYPVVRRALV